MTELKTIIENDKQDSNPYQEIGLKKEGQDLAEILKSTHKDLRAATIKCKNESEVHSAWINHTMKKELLQKYSKAMHSLATEYWDKRNNISRIKWIYDAVKEYYSGELLLKKLEKERRRILILQPEKMESFEIGARRVKERTQKNSRWKVLDVGSCYNPFAKFEDLDVLPIDLYPAKPEVYSCDFLGVHIKSDHSHFPSSIGKKAKHLEDDDSSQEPKKKRNKSESEGSVMADPRVQGKADLKLQHESELELNENRKRALHLSETCDSEINSETKTYEESGELHDAFGKGQSQKERKELETSIMKYDINELYSESFDVVIFSFLLEYIPTAKLRYQCCSKAYELLTSNGLLCIVTPDSKHETGNSHVFRMWKIALLNLGFERIKYEKCAHFHGMVFRKALVPTALNSDIDRELTSMKSRAFFGKYSKLNWSSVRNSLYLVQEMQGMKN